MEPIRVYGKQKKQKTFPKRLKTPVLDEMLEAEEWHLKRDFRRCGGNRVMWIRKKAVDMVDAVCAGRKIRCAFCGEEVELCNHLHYGYIARHVHAEHAVSCPSNSESATTSLARRLPAGA